MDRPSPGHVGGQHPGMSPHSSSGMVAILISFDSIFKKRTGSLLFSGSEKYSSSKSRTLFFFVFWRLRTSPNLTRRSFFIKGEFFSVACINTDVERHHLVFFRLVHGSRLFGERVTENLELVTWKIFPSLAFIVSRRTVTPTDHRIRRDLSLSWRESAQRKKIQPQKIDFTTRFLVKETYKISRAHRQSGENAFC